MFWIGMSAIVILFFSTRAFMNNNQRWQKRNFPQQFGRMYYLILQGTNLLLIVASVLFLVLAIVCHVKGFKLTFSSDYLYHMQINSG